jgi:tRNA-dihydrouridine synthase B
VADRQGTDGPDLSTAAGSVTSWRAAGPPVLALAPMQEITDGAFWTLVHRYGGADVYWTEYFRVQADSTPERRILDAIRGNATGRPVIAQMIGNDIPGLVRTARVLEREGVAAVDLNLGCPAPVVYRKCAGGGLLREPDRIDAILGALRQTLTIPFTVKTRVGFQTVDEFETLLPIFARHGLDALTVHARTVAQLYRLPVHYDLIRRAVDVMPCPVLANGHVHTAAQAAEVLAATGARGLMIGRAAIRSPWLFTQIREQLAGRPVTLPSGREVWAYVRALWASQAVPGRPERSHCERMKKFLNYLGEGVPAPFLHQIRRTQTAADFHRICAEFLDHDQSMALPPAELMPAQ